MGRKKEKREVDIHHRRPRSLGGSNKPENLSTVSKSQHRAWHTLFWNLPPAGIVAVINALWLDPEWKLLAVPAGLMEYFVGYLAVRTMVNRYENMYGDGI